MTKQQPEPLRFLPSIADWAEADAPAAELTERIMSGMDCVNPAKFEQHVKATITAYLAQEAAERRGYARRARRGMRGYAPRRADDGG